MEANSRDGVCLRTFVHQRRRRIGCEAARIAACYQDATRKGQAIYGGSFSRRPQARLARLSDRSNIALTFQTKIPLHPLEEVCYFEDRSGLESLAITPAFGSPARVLRTEAPC